MKVSRECRGIVHWCNKDQLFISRGYDIYYSSDNGINVHRLCSLPVTFKSKLKGSCRILSRLLRGGIRFMEYDNDKLYILAEKKVYIYNISQDNFDVISDLVVGSNPLNLCVSNGKVYYGCYWGNPNREPVSIYSLSGSSWKKIYTFENIRHIHGVFKDPYTDYFWVTTGDLDSEAAIWVSKDGLKTLTPVVHSSQQSRAIKLIFTEENIYYGSDTPSELNHLYSLNRKSGIIHKICKVNGSVFFGCKSRNKIFFSTAVEPSPINQDRNASVWGGDIGDTHSWRNIVSFEKDVLPMKLFQYGQVYFPQEQCFDGSIWCTPLGTEKDYKSVLIDLEI
jgi:hypothetical protein